MDAALSHLRNVITRAVGHKDYVEVDTREIEVVPNFGWLKEGDDARILRELRDLVEAATNVLSA